MTKRSPRIVQAERLRDQVYRVVLDEMRSGDLKPGQRLYELELAQKYGVSRTPIREALFQLVREGLLIEAERGYVFPEATRKDTENRLEIRLLLDPPIVRRAALEGTSDQLKVLGKALDREVESLDDKNPRTFIEANSIFRHTLRAMCGNKLLAKCATQIDDQFQYTRIAIFQDLENRRLTVRHHQRIFDAVSRHDAASAEEATRDFLLQLFDYFKEKLRDMQPA
jgi:DNA-binding GntR family transcriptional regulator